MLCTINPFTSSDYIRRNLASLFNSEDDFSARYSYPLINAYDSADTITVVAEVPGVTKDNLSVNYENGTLKISGKRNSYDDKKEQSLLRKERAYGSFDKTLQIPVKIDDTKITASLKNGIITVVLPKSDDVKPKSISIN